MPWYHKSYGRYGNRSKEEVTAQWRLQVAEEELVAEEEAARRKEEQRLRAENDHRRAIERAERLHELGRSYSNFDLKSWTQLSCDSSRPYLYFKSSMRSPCDLSSFAPLSSSLRVDQPTRDITKR